MRGAIVLDDQQCSMELCRLSTALVDCFAIPKRSIRIEAANGKITAEDLYTAVWNVLAEQDAAGQLAVYPEAIDAVREATERFLQRKEITGRTRSINLGTPLVAVFGGCRIADWGALTVELGQPLPDLAIRQNALQIVGWICAAAVIGLMVVIAQWLDRAHPVEQPSTGLHVAGKILGKIMFVVIFFPLMWVMIRLMLRWLVRFPDDCAVVGQLVAVVGRADPSDQPMGGWTAELLWREIQECVASAYGKSPRELTADFELMPTQPRVS